MKENEEIVTDSVGVIDRIQFTAFGIECELRKLCWEVGGKFWWNGYLKCSELKITDVDEIQPHGGWTFDDGEWIGFDTKHGLDTWNENYCGFMNHWTVEKLRGEVSRVAMLIAEWKKK